MPGCFTEAANHAVLDHLFGGRTIPPPDRIHFGLSLAPANKFGLIVEPAAPEYRRTSVPACPLMFPPARDGRTVNGQAIPFPTAESEWGLIRSVFAATAAGNVLAMADLVEPIEVRPGQTKVIEPGGLVFSHD